MQTRQFLERNVVFTMYHYGNYGYNLVTGDRYGKMRAQEPHTDCTECSRTVFTNVRCYF